MSIGDQFACAVLAFMVTGVVLGIVQYIRVWVRVSRFDRERAAAYLRQDAKATVASTGKAKPGGKP